MRLPQTTTDTALNMTPMIDIVFQLILFFLFNLRFKSVDWRIESALPRVGEDVTPPQTLREHLRVVLARRDADDPVAARTVVRIGSAEWVLPPLSAAAEERDAVLARVRDRIRALDAEYPRPGEIDTPPPRGPLVPHADVVAVLDAFLQAGVREVEFQGARRPR